MPLVNINGRVIEVDYAAADYNSTYLVTLDEAHHKIHEGREFRLYDYDSDVDAATPKYWLAISPAVTRVHLKFSVSAGKPGLIQGFGGSTVSANGTPISIANADGDSANTPEHQFFSDPTVTADGIQAFAEFIGTVGNNPVGAVGGAFHTDREVIAPTDTVLLLKFTAEYDNTPVSVSAWWYEAGDNSVDP